MSSLQKLFAKVSNLSTQAANDDIASIKQKPAAAAAATTPAFKGGDRKQLLLHLCDVCGKGDLNAIKQILQNNKGISLYDEHVVSTSRVTRVTIPFSKVLQSKNLEAILYCLNKYPLELHKTVRTRMEDGRRHTRETSTDALCDFISSTANETTGPMVLVLSLLVDKVPDINARVATMCYCGDDVYVPMIFN